MDGDLADLFHCKKKRMKYLVNQLSEERSVNCLDAKRFSEMVEGKIVRCNNYLHSAVVQEGQELCERVRSGRSNWTS